MQGFRVSGCEGLRFFFWGLRVSGFQGFKGFRVRGFEDFRFEGFRVSGFHGSRVSGFQGKSQMPYLPKDFVTMMLSNVVTSQGFSAQWMQSDFFPKHVWQGRSCPSKLKTQNSVSKGVSNR